MTSEPLRILAREMKDPRLTLFVLLQTRRENKPGTPLVSRRSLREISGITEWTMDRALRWLRKAGLIDSLRGRVEVYYYSEY